MDDEAKAERLRRLQAIEMADLGTARREYISTVDNKYKHVTMDKINADREINKKGSAGQRLAETNKTELSAWNDAWKDIAGDVAMESLDTLMDGQSHRARLSKEIRGDDDQKYAHVAARDSVSHRVMKVKAANKAVSRSVPSRASQGRTAGKSPTPKSALKLAGVNRAENPLDPARECNNRSPPPGGVSKKKGPAFTGRRPPRPPTMKTRRAVHLPSAESWESKLADSGTFMEAIRSVFPSKSDSQQSIFNPETAVNDTHDRTESLVPAVETKPEAKSAPVFEPTGSGKQDLGADPAAIDTITVNSKEPTKPKSVNRSASPSGIRIQVSSTPSPDDREAAASGTTKRRLGFNSSLPQPMAPWATSTHDEKPPAKSSGPSALDAKPNPQAIPKAIAPQEPSTPVRKSAPVSATDNNGIDQTKQSDMLSSELHDELDKLTKLLADTSMLPAAAVTYLKERKEGLESELGHARGATHTEGPPGPKPPPLTDDDNDPFRPLKEPKAPFPKESPFTVTTEHNLFGPPTTKPDISFPPKQQHTKTKVPQSVGEQAPARGSGLFGSSTNAPAPLTPKEQKPSRTEDSSCGPFTKTKVTHFLGDKVPTIDVGLFGSSTDAPAAFSPKPQPIPKERSSRDLPIKFDTGEQSESIIGDRWLPGRGVTGKAGRSSGKINNQNSAAPFNPPDKPLIPKAPASRESRAGLPANFPISAATMQYFKAPIAPVEERPSATENVATSCTVNNPIAPKSVQSPAGAKGSSHTKKDSPVGPQANLTAKGINVPITAATLQYGRDLFSPGTKQTDSRSNGHDTTPIPTQSEQRTMSAGAASFKPTQKQAENDKHPGVAPSAPSQFQSREEKEGVSIKAGNGLYASKYAN